MLKVLVTSDNQRQIKLLDQSGFKPIVAPLLFIQSIKFEIENIHLYDWIFFTSKNAVKYFFESLVDELPQTLKIATVGDSTAKYIEKYGYKVDFFPTKFNGDTFSEELSKILMGNEKILFPKGNLARIGISQQLRKNNVIIDDIIVYETKMNLDMKDKLISLLQEGIDIVTFASPSAVEYFYQIVGDSFVPKIVACIGPVTKKKLLTYGIKPNIVAEPSNFEGMVQALIRWENNNE